jgi:hypothetical protein
MNGSTQTVQTGHQTDAQTTATTAAKRPIMQVRIEGILKAHGLWEKWQKGEVTSVKLTKANYMPLVIERVTTLGAGGVVPAVAVMHYFVQEGDVMMDPEVVFTADAWEPTEITQHPLGSYRAKYHRQGSRTLINVRFQRDMGPFVRMWAQNLKEQGWADPQTTKVARASK